MRITFGVIFFFISWMSLAQETNSNSFVDLSYFKGNIALHDDDLLQLIQGHPEGFILGWNKKTFGNKKWESLYNYPDYGLSFTYQNLKNDVLGDNYGLYGHFNFYFFNRKLMFRIAQGLALTSNPYDKVDNHKNIAFGSKFLSSTYLMLNYKHERIIDRFGLQAGFSLIHYSNANVKAPNKSVNTITFNLGLNYNLDDSDSEYIKHAKEKFTERIRYNLVVRGGVNESDVVGSGQFPFYVFSAYADKRLSYKSAIQFGADFFVSKFLEEYIKYRAVSFPEENSDPNADYKRVGIFAGHELFINKLSVLAQFGYYVYYPYEFEGRTYIRAGLNYYFNDKWFASLTLKSHAARAEAVEIGIGIRL